MTAQPAQPDPLAVELWRRRRAAGMTQREVGKRLNYTHQSVGCWERGEHDPPLAVLRAWAALFGLAPTFRELPEARGG